MVFDDEGIRCKSVPYKFRAAVYTGWMNHPMGFIEYDTDMLGSPIVNRDTQQITYPLATLWVGIDEGDTTLFVPTPFYVRYLDGAPYLCFLAAGQLAYMYAVDLEDLDEDDRDIDDDEEYGLGDGGYDPDPDPVDPSPVYALG